MTPHLPHQFHPRASTTKKISSGRAVHTFIADQLTATPITA